LGMIHNYFSITPSFTVSYRKYYPYDNKVIETTQGVDIDQFFPVTQSVKNELRRKLNIPEGSFLIISVGVLVIRKGYIKIFRELAKLNFPFIYIVLGDYDLSFENMPNKKRKRAKDIFAQGKQLLSEKIIFKGFVDNVNEYLQASDIFLTSSMREGLSNALLESMACGIPAVIKELDSLNGYILKTGENCLFFQLDEEMSSALQNLHNNLDLRKEIGVKASETIRKAYSFHHVFNRLNIVNISS